MSRYSKETLLYQALKERIQRGELPRGSKLPSVRKLAEEFKASNTTIAKVFSQLVKEDLIVRPGTSGVYVKGEVDKDLTATYQVEPSKQRAEAIACWYRKIKKRVCFGSKK